MLVECQAATKAHTKYTVTIITVLNCIRNLNQLGKQNHVSRYIAWIPGHAGVGYMVTNRAGRLKRHRKAQAKFRTQKFLSSMHKRKFRNQNFLGLKRKRKFRHQKFLSSMRKRKFCNQNFLGLKRKRKIPQPKFF